MSDKKGVNGIVIAIAVILFIGIFLGVWGYLIKTNKFINLGDKLRPFIQDIPVINMILPDSSIDADPTTFARSELERLYAELTAENEILSQKNDELESETLVDVNIEDEDEYF